MLQEGVCEYSVLVLQSAVAPHGGIRNGSQSTNLGPGYACGIYERLLSVLGGQYVRQDWTEALSIVLVVVDGAEL